MSDAITAATFLTSLASSGGILLIYNKLKKLDNLAALHAQYHPEDKPLLED